MHLQNFIRDNRTDCRIIRRKPITLKLYPKVTIAIALICKDGILMASDSRTTNPDFSIRDNAKKIRLVKMKHLHCALVAQSGDDDLGTRIVDRIEQIAKDVSILDYQTVSELGDKAIVARLSTSSLMTAPRFLAVTPATTRVFIFPPCSISAITGVF